MTLLIPSTAKSQSRAAKRTAPASVLTASVAGRNLLTLHFNHWLPATRRYWRGQARRTVDKRLCARADTLHLRRADRERSAKPAVSLRVYYAAELGRGFTRRTLHRAAVCGNFMSIVHRKGHRPVGGMRSSPRMHIRERMCLSLSLSLFFLKNYSLNLSQKKATNVIDFFLIINSAFELAGEISNIPSSLFICGEHTLTAMLDTLVDETVK